jgi:hypothetical protein
VQNMNPMTTPNHPRKRQDTRHTPYETYGMPLRREFERHLSWIQRIGGEMGVFSFIACFIPQN